MIGVLILAGGSVADKIKFIRAGCRCPALIPVNTRPCIQYIFDSYEEAGDVLLYLAINTEYVDIVKSELSLKRMNLKIIELPETRNVNESLEYCLEEMSESDTVIVNLVTTIPGYIPAYNEVLVDQSLNISVDWSGIRQGDLNDVEFIFKHEDSFNIKCHAFTGVFHANRQDLQKSVVTDSDDLLKTVSRLSERAELDFIKTEWIDCGHEQNYHEAKSKLITSRSFNTIIIRENSIVRKSSQDRNKLMDEFMFYKMIPPEISRLFPRIISEYTDTGSNEGSYEIEYYGYPNVSELSLYWDLSGGIWGRFFDQVCEHMLLFKRYRYSIGINAHRKFYIDKLFTRLEMFRIQLINRNERCWIDEDIIVNNVVCKNIYKLKEQITKKLEELYNESDFCVTHGDLCFNNILYDTGSGIIKYIDPRGSFGNNCKGIYGDQKYDLAKLLHSAEGAYDYIVNGLYEQEEDNGQYTYKIMYRRNYNTLFILAKNLVEKTGYNYDAIKFIMATLFISMVPLHVDSYKKQKTLYMHGLKMLNEQLLQ